MLNVVSMNDVDAFFGIHVWTFLPSGIIGVRNDPLLASANGFKALIHRGGGHTAQPNQAVGPIVISREANLLKPAVASVKGLKAGATFNFIPETSEAWSRR